MAGLDCPVYQYRRLDSWFSVSRHEQLGTLTLHCILSFQGIGMGRGWGFWKEGGGGVSGLRAAGEWGLRGEGSWGEKGSGGWAERGGGSGEKGGFEGERGRG